MQTHCKLDAAWWVFVLHAKFCSWTRGNMVKRACVTSSARYRNSQGGVRGFSLRIGACRESNVFVNMWRIVFSLFWVRNFDKTCHSGRYFQSKKNFKKDIALACSVSGRNHKLTTWESGFCRFWRYVCALQKGAMTIVLREKNSTLVV